MISCGIPLEADEIPVVIGVHPGDVEVTEGDATSFSVRNTTDRAAPFIAVVVRRPLADLATMPWRDALQHVKTLYSEGNLNGFFENLLTIFSPKGS